MLQLLTLKELRFDTRFTAGVIVYINEPILSGLQVMINMTLSDNRRNYNRQWRVKSFERKVKEESV